MLTLRGLRVTPSEAAAIVTGRQTRFRPEHQEHKLVLGFARTLTELETRAQSGAGPDGWWMLEQFRRTTEQVGRFRNNIMRRDEPWDSIPGVSYPRSDRLQGLIDGFHSAEWFGDDQALFEGLHPVRQSFRILWRFAHIAPFPDLNLSFAVVALCGWLRAQGYPLLVPGPGDRQRIERVVRGPLPLRIVPLEIQLLDSTTDSKTRGAH